jgi:hypothetical protein
MEVGNESFEEFRIHCLSEERKDRPAIAKPAWTVTPPTVPGRYWHHQLDMGGTWCAQVVRSLSGEYAGLFSEAGCATFLTADEALRNEGQFWLVALMESPQ